MIWHLQHFLRCERAQQENRTHRLGSFGEFAALRPNGGFRKFGQLFPRTAEVRPDIASLFVPVISLIPEQNFPLKKLREMALKHLFSWPKSSRQVGKSAKPVVFPCIFPVNRDFWRRLDSLGLGAQPNTSSRADDTTVVHDSDGISVGYGYARSTQTARAPQISHKIPQSLRSGFGRYECPLSCVQRAAIRARWSCQSPGRACRSGAIEVSTRL